MGFDRNALRGPVFRDYSRDGLLDYIVWYRLDRMAPLACGEYDQRFDAMTSDGQMLTGRLRFVVTGCAP